MANAEAAGFTGEAFQVYTRQAGSFGSTHPLPLDDDAREVTVAAAVGASDEQAAT
jgi:hypothetical protein